MKHVIRCVFTNRIIPLIKSVETFSDCDQCIYCEIIITDIAGLYLVNYRAHHTKSNLKIINDYPCLTDEEYAIKNILE